VLAYETAQRIVGHQVVALAAQASDERAHADGEDVVAVQVAPDPAQGAGRLDGLGARCDERGVECAADVPTSRSAVMSRS